MPSEPLREQAILQIVALLETMTGTRPWGGTYPDPVTVSREVVAVEQVNRFPHCIVVEDDASEMTIFEAGPGADGTYQHAFRVSVYGYVKATTGVGRSTWLERLWDDVVTTLLASQGLGGIAAGIGLDPRLTDTGAFEPLGAFAQDLVVTMHESKGVE